MDITGSVYNIPSAPQSIHLLSKNTPRREAARTIYLLQTEVVIPSVDSMHPETSLNILASQCSKEASSYIKQLAKEELTRKGKNQKSTDFNHPQKYIGCTSPHILESPSEYDRRSMESIPGPHSSSPPDFPLVVSDRWNMPKENSTVGLLGVNQPYEESLSGSQSLSDERNPKRKLSSSSCNDSEFSDCDSFEISPSNDRHPSPNPSSIFSIDPYETISASPRRKSLKSKDDIPCLDSALKEFIDFHAKHSLGKSVRRRGIELLHRLDAKRSLRTGYVTLTEVVAACLFTGCRLEGVPCTFKEICSLTHLKKRQLSRATRMISKVLGITLEPISARDFIERYCSNLTLRETIRETAIEVSKRALSTGLVSGKCPISVAAAAIALVSGCTEKQIVSMSGVSLTTIRNCYNTLVKHKEQLLLGIQTPPDTLHSGAENGQIFQSIHNPLHEMDPHSDLTNKRGSIDFLAKNQMINDGSSNQSIEEPKQQENHGSFSNPAQRPSCGKHISLDPIFEEFSPTNKKTKHFTGSSKRSSIQNSDTFVPSPGFKSISGKSSPSLSAPRLSFSALPPVPNLFYDSVAGSPHAHTAPTKPYGGGSPESVNRNLDGTSNLSNSSQTYFPKSSRYSSPMIGSTLKAFQHELDGISSSRKESAPDVSSGFLHPHRQSSPSLVDYSNMKSGPFSVNQMLPVQETISARGRRVSFPTSPHARNSRRKLSQHHSALNRPTLCVPSASGENERRISTGSPNISFHKYSYPSNGGSHLAQQPQIPPYAGSPSFFNPGNPFLSPRYSSNPFFHLFATKPPTLSSAGSSSYSPQMKSPRKSLVILPKPEREESNS